MRRRRCVRSQPAAHMTGSKRAGRTIHDGRYGIICGALRLCYAELLCSMWAARQPLEAACRNMHRGVIQAEGQP